MKIQSARTLPVTKTGLYRGVSLDDYHSPVVIPDGQYAVSSTDLRTAWSKSLAHMFDQWAHNPKRAPRKPTREMILGIAAHHLLLGETRFATSFIQQPLEYRDLRTAMFKPWNNNADVCKEWTEKQSKAGRIIVKYDELERINGMAASIALEPLVKDGILSGAAETSGFVKDTETGLWIKVRPDIIPTTGGDYVDLKTIFDISNRGVSRRIREAAYHMQGGLIWEWCDQVGENFETFTLAFIESDRPFCARMVPVEDEDLARGRQQCRAMLRQIATCIDKGHWPGPGEGELRSIWLSKEEREAIDKRLQREGA